LIGQVAQLEAKETRNEDEEALLAGYRKDIISLGLQIDEAFRCVCGWCWGAQK
jgi:hypothetical protein